MLPEDRLLLQNSLESYVPDELQRVTFYSERFPHCERFAVGVDGNLVVQQRFVHDERVQLLRVGPE